MLRMRITAIMIALIMMLSLVNSTMAAPVDYGEENLNQSNSSSQVSFTDVPNTHWAYKYIADMVNRKVISGYPDNKFRPNNTISRAEFATIIIKAAGLQAAKVNYSSFSDVKVTDWYSPFIETAKDYLTGYRMANGQYNFNPTAPAVREDITIAIVKLKGYDVARLSNRSTIEAMFKDYEGISESAKDYVSIAVENGLVSGYQDETFRPQNSITRAEAAALLWRAFMYGNDNKGVGGDSGATTGVTPPVKQPDGQVTPQPTTQPSQNDNSEKFSVDTLVGGTGRGDVDGPVSKAKLNQVDSMVLDKDNNIFFLDKDKRKVRKFNKSNGSVETFLKIGESFSWNYQKGNQTTRYDSKYFTPNQLAYNIASNKLYLSGQREDNEHAVNLYEISPSVTMTTYYFDTSNWRVYSTNFIKFDGQDSLLAYINTGGDSVIINLNEDGESGVIANSGNSTGVKLEYEGNVNYGGMFYAADAVVMRDHFFEFDKSINKLWKVTYFPRKVEMITQLNNLSFQALTTYNGKFYLTSGASIYELSLDGKLTTFVNGKDLTYNDGSPINKIEHFTFDSLGNIILYEDSSKSIRRINL